MKLKDDKIVEDDISCCVCPYEQYKCPPTCPSVKAAYHLMSMTGWQDRFKEMYCEE